MFMNNTQLSSSFGLSTKLTAMRCQSKQVHGIASMYTSVVAVREMYAAITQHQGQNSQLSESF
jgi:hypothetical protein